MDLTTDTSGLDTLPEDISSTEKPEARESDKALAQKIVRTIRADKEHHKTAFAQMKRDMFIARYGRTPDYPEGHYVANLAGRHVKQKTAALYAKNPRAIAKRRETMDFAVWDETPESLQIAMMTIQQAQMMMAAAPPMQDPLTGAVVPAQPQLPPGFEEAQALVADFQAGTQRRQMITKIGKTLEILFAHALREQKPVDFKTAAKKLVRRTCTTGVGYAELAFQREYGPRPDTTERLADARTRLDHLKRLTTEAQEGDITVDDAEMAELEASVAALQAEPEIVLREGLVIDFPASTMVIPDKLTKSLVGFIGARHLTIQYLFTTDEVKEMFDVDLGKNFRGYSADGKSTEDGAPDSARLVQDDNSPALNGDTGQGLVCVWKHYDKPSGLCYYVADGYGEFLRPPASPDVFVEDFWPVYALTFNDVESEDELFPPSDVSLILGMQMEHNRSRQGKREHRKAARPRWGYANGSIEKDDVDAMSTAEPFSATGLNLPQGAKLSDILEAFPVPGVDPNLYDTNEIFTDIQMVVGSQESSFGGVSKATATESAIAANSTNSSDGSSIDDLDAFLTMLARASGQILLKEMSEEQVKRIVGPGALWPQMTLADIAEEVFLEVEAGSTGKPNQGVEINNLERLAPYLIQLEGITPMWLAKQFVSRLDDKIDLTEAITEGMPSLVARNAMAQPGTGDPATEPTAQGGQGADNGPKPEAQGGSSAAFGSNQV